MHTNTYWGLNEVFHSGSKTFFLLHTKDRHTVHLTYYADNLLSQLWATFAWMTLGVSTVTSLLWRRAGRLRVDSRVCCMTPSRSQRTVWRYRMLSLELFWCQAAACCVLLFFHELCVVTVKKTLPFVVLDVERVDVAAWRPEFLQWPLLSWVSWFACMWYSTASVWMGCQSTWGVFSSVTRVITAGTLFA